MSQLSKEEELFRSTVRSFATREVAPLVREMEERGAIPCALIDQLFEADIMAIEIPESHGGVGGRFFPTNARRCTTLSMKGGCANSDSTPVS